MLLAACVCVSMDGFLFSLIFLSVYCSKHKSSDTDRSERVSIKLCLSKRFTNINSSFIKILRPVCPTGQVLCMSTKRCCLDYKEDLVDLTKHLGYVNDTGDWITKPTSFKVVQSKSCCELVVSLL